MGALRALASRGKSTSSCSVVIPLLPGPATRTSDMSDAPERLMDIAEVAERLGIGQRFVRRLVEERRIPYFKIGRHGRFRRDDVAH